MSFRTIVGLIAVFMGMPSMVLLYGWVLAKNGRGGLFPDWVYRLSGIRKKIFLCFFFLFITIGMISLYICMGDFCYKLIWVGIP